MPRYTFGLGRDARLSFILSAKSIFCSGEIILLGLARGDNGRALIESEHNQKFKKRDIYIT